MPHAGEQAVYIQRAFGKLPGFALWMDGVHGNRLGIVAAVAVAFAKYPWCSSRRFPPTTSRWTRFLQVSAAQVYAVCTIVL